MADQAASSGPRAYQRVGDHVDTIESVDIVFKKQRTLSFSYGAVFFAVTLAIPALTVWASYWGGSYSFTHNVTFIILVRHLYFFFLWIMAWTYARRADHLDKELGKLADDMTHDFAEKLAESEDYET